MRAGARAGVISTPAFTNSTAGAEYVAADGEWLNSPDAALFTDGGSSNQAVLLQLSAPSYNAETKVGGCCLFCFCYWRCHSFFTCCHVLPAQSAKH